MGFFLNLDIASVRNIMLPFFSPVFDGYKKKTDQFLNYYVEIYIDDPQWFYLHMELA
jgi:hypothetical protein